MSNDISTSTPTAAPASAPPASAGAGSESSTASNAVYARLAASDKIDDTYAAQREDDQREADGTSEPGDQHDDEGPSEADGTDEQGRLTRSERRRRREAARDAKIEKLERRLQLADARAQEEAAEEQRTPLTPPLPPGMEEADNVLDYRDQLIAAQEAQNQDGGQAENGAAEAAAYEQQPPMTRDEFVDRVVEEAQQNLQRRDRATTFRLREQVAAAHIPAFHETIAQAPRVQLSQPMFDEIEESNAGPLLRFGIAKIATDYARGVKLAPDDEALLRALPTATPRQAAKLVAKIESMLEAGARQARAAAAAPARPQPQLPKSWTGPRPIKPLIGGAGPSPSLAQKAEGEKVSADYVADFQRRMRRER